jgi:hypothetical protein
MYARCCKVSGKSYAKPRSGISGENLLADADILDGQKHHPFLLPLKNTLDYYPGSEVLSIFQIT